MVFTALIGLGSNLNHPIQQLAAAIKSVREHHNISLLACSSFYQSRPQGPQDQDLFINAVIAIETSLEPQSLLIALQDIEKRQGKVKVRHWGERCIDIDILFVDKLVLSLTNPDLIIPHPHAVTRDFVLIPALEIAPDWQLSDGSLLKGYLQNCLKHDLLKLPSNIKC